MKSIACKTFLLSFLLIFSFSLFAAETLTLDPKHTYILWRIKHLGFSTQVGKMYASGTLIIDKEKPQNAKLDVTVDIANISTGLAELDEHLKGPLFFNVKAFPKARFVSSKVDLTGKDTAKVEGTLTLHGVSKPLTLDVKLGKIGENPITSKMTAGFSAKTSLKRSDFGMTSLLPALDDEVQIDIGAEAYK